jgi:hypothetical protein
MRSNARSDEPAPGVHLINNYTGIAAWLWRKPVEVEEITIGSS